MQKNNSLPKPNKADQIMQKIKRQSTINQRISKKIFK